MAGLNIKPRAWKTISALAVLTVLNHLWIEFFTYTNNLYLLASFHLVVIGVALVMLSRTPAKADL